MIDRVSELAVEFGQWLEHAGNCEGVEELLSGQDDGEWRDFVSRFPRRRRVEITGILIQRAHALLSSSPKDAEPVARLAIRFAREAILSSERDEVGLFDIEAATDLEGDAWREHAHALLTIGNYNAARLSGNEAAFCYGLASRDPGDGTLSALLFNAAGTQAEKARVGRVAILALIMGQVLHGEGESEEGLLLIEQASHVFLSWLENKHKYVQGRTIYAKILADLRRFPEAAATLENTAHLARELGDSETLAHIVNNIGFCYYHTGHITKARKCLETALALFDSLGLKADGLRPRNYLATILINEGSYYRAISELFISRASYLEAGLPNEAAEVMLKIIRAHILSRRAGSINWDEIHRTFSAAGLRDEAMKALTHLSQVSQKRTLRVGDVERAEEILSRLTAESTAAEEAG